MANKVPLILNTTNSTLEELPSGDNLDLSGSNISSVGNITAGNSVSANYFVGTLYGQANSAITANTAGTVTDNAQPNITSVGTLSNLTVTGNIVTGNVSGNGAGLTGLTGANITGQVSNALVSGTVYTNSQPNITSVGTLSNLTSNGTINFTNASNVSLGNISNVKITGGSNNQLIATDGNGNLSFATVSGDSFQLRPVRVATASIITLSGTQTIDGVALNVGDRVLVWMQGNGPFTPDINNGIYVVQSGTWTRTSDFNTGSETLSGGVTVVAREGTNLGGETFVCRNTGTIIIGTTGILFSRSSSMNGLISIWNTGGGFVNKADGLNSGALAIGVSANAAVDAVAIGYNALANVGGPAAGGQSVSVGYGAVAGGSGVSVGYGAAARSSSVSVGRDARSNSNTESIAIGFSSNSSGQSSIVIGGRAIANNTQSIAIGTGTSTATATVASGFRSIAIGQNNFSTTGSTIAIGHSSNSSGVGAIVMGVETYANVSAGGPIPDFSIVIGPYARSHAVNGIRIGQMAGGGGGAQGNNSIAIGVSAGFNGIGLDAIAIGNSAGNANLGLNSIAIGANAGFSNLNANSIAIGTNSARSNGHANTITLNATGANLNTTQADSFFVSPIRNLVQANVLSYNPNTGEITHSALANYTANIGAGNISVNNGNIVLNSNGRIDYLRTYGSFTSNSTQSSNGANTVNFMTFNNTEDANGISITNNNEITIQRTGRYNIQFSAQIMHDVSQTANVEIWLRKNGVNVSNTNTILTLTKDERMVAAWDWNVFANAANDYYQIAWASSDINVELLAIDAGNTIANVSVPSVIVDVNPIGA